jgi:hypothetical protein
MFVIRRHPVVAALVVAGLLAVVAERVVAQNPTIKGKGKVATVIHQTGTIAAGNGIMIDANLLDDGPTAIFVPEKMTMVITDLIISNAGAGGASFFVSRSQIDAAPLTHSIEIPAGTTFSYNFGLGLEFPEGSGANIFSAGEALGYTVRGYLRKGT